MVVTRKEFRARLRDIAPDVFNRVIRDAKDTVEDEGCNSIAWANVLVQPTQDEKIDKLLEHYGRDGWDVLLKALDGAVKDATGRSLMGGQGEC